MRTPNTPNTSSNAAFNLAPVQTFAAAADRKRLTPAALEAMRRIAEAWQLSGDQAAALLGVSLSTWDRIKNGTAGTSLSQDQLMRVSALIGIFKGLHLLFADGMADRWPRLPNSGPLFANHNPVEAMMQGGIPRMIDVRRYVDAIRGGV